MRAAPIESECFLTDTDVAAEAEPSQRRGGPELCLSVRLCVWRWGVNLRLKNDHWLPVMHNREGLESTKQQTVWWSTKMCSSGAHWKMIADYTFEVCQRRVCVFSGTAMKLYLSCLCRQFSLSFSTNCSMMCVLLSRLELRLPNSFHLLDLGLTASQTTKSDKSELSRYSPAGVLLYSRREALISLWEQQVSL